jgi:hypothetical protein
MADAPDSKSGGVNPREGSSPSSGTTFGLFSILILVSPQKSFDIHGISPQTLTNIAAVDTRSLTLRFRK